MNKFIVGALALLGSAAFAQETPPGGPGPWSFQEYVVSVVEVAKGVVLPLHNTGELKVIPHTFATADDCNAARNTALNPGGFTFLLGTGGGIFAHIGRACTECFHQ